MADGMDHVRALRAAAEEIAPPRAPERDPPTAPPEDEAPVLPERCPVVPLGVQGEVVYYLDQLRQLRSLKAKDHSRLNLQQMFGVRSDLLYDFWPRKSQDKQTGEWVTTGWKPELAAEALMQAASRRGVWSPQDCVRGAGAWRGPDGELVWHCGHRLIVAHPDGRAWEVEPGVVEGMVYPSAPAIALPARPRQKPAPDGPGEALLGLLRTWQWRRGEVDAYLMLGWIAAGMLGGALKWRPVAWVTGSRGTGKSTLQDLIKWLMGTSGILQSADPTPAGIRQVLGYASLPVAVDEAEPEGDGDRVMQGLIKLARMAASGSLALRGGSDHQASQFTLRSCVLFSSILIPPLLPQDRSRMAILELDPLKADAGVPPVTERRMGELGERIKRRLVDQWPRLDGTVDAYRDALRQCGHSARGQDVFGTLLACADLVLYDHPPDADTLMAWREKLAADTLAELIGDDSDENACLKYLLSTVVEMPHDRQRTTIGRWIGVAAGRLTDADPDRAQKLLLNYGLKIHTEACVSWLAVANKHRGLDSIFANTPWAGRPGAMGGWVQALKRLPHMIPTGAGGKPKALWFGVTEKGFCLPLALCLPTPEGGPQDGPAPAPGPGAGSAGHDAAGAGARAGDASAAPFL